MKRCLPAIIVVLAAVILAAAFALAADFKYVGSKNPANITTPPASGPRR